MSDNTKQEPDTLPPLDISGGSKYVPQEAGIGERIKMKRRELGFTVEQLSAFTAAYDYEQSDLWEGGVSAASIYRYEKEGDGKSLPGAREIRLLSYALNVSPNWLILGYEWNLEGEMDKRIADAARSLQSLVGEAGAFHDRNKQRDDEHSTKLALLKERTAKAR